MTGRVAYYGLLAVVAVLAAVTDVCAQRYPERRIAREGTRLYEKGDFAEAEAAYRRALESNPGLGEAAYNLGGALWRQERAREAADVWTSVAADSLADGGMVSAANYNVGNAALASQQIDAAIEAYKRSLRLRPDDMEAKYNLAYAQKLKRQQEDKDQDDKGGGDGGGRDDRNQDQNQDQGQGQDGDGGGGDDRNDPQDGDGDPNEQNGGETPPSPGSGEAKIDPHTARQMLDAMQAAEDATREKVNAREVQTGARSGKNW